MASVQEEIEEILVDCYDEEEMFSAWEVTFEDEVETPFSASLLGVAVEVQKFRANDARVLQCLVKRPGDEKTRWIGIEDLDEDGLPEDFQHILMLYQAWQDGGY